MLRSLAVLAAAAGVLGGFAAAFPALADSSEAPLSQTIEFGRSELQSRDGIVRVHRQLDEAARSVCRGFESRDLDRQSLFRRCVTQSLARAIADVHDARLTAYHERRTGRLLTARR